MHTTCTCKSIACEFIWLLLTGSVDECLMEGKRQQGFPEAAQEVLDNSTDDIDITDLVQLGVTTSAKETITKLLDSLVISGKRSMAYSKHEQTAFRYHLLVVAWKEKGCLAI